MDSLAEHFDSRTAEQILTTMDPAYYTSLVAGLAYRMRLEAESFARFGDAPNHGEAYEVAVTIFGGATQAVTDFMGQVAAGCAWNYEALTQMVAEARELSGAKAITARKEAEQEELDEARVLLLQREKTQDLQTIGMLSDIIRETRVILNQMAAGEGEGDRFWKDLTALRHRIEAVMPDSETNPEIALV